ncbi:MAG: hypothetical protein JWN52_670 [Actinomycetia bacterium]|jgi:uncharacterized protein YndB with AHSA1/START domain|nr:hypothetical protein [Actinomycetes bacterium]
MATITVSTDLLSPPDRLWPLLIDFSGYADWMVVHDSFVTEPPTDPVPGDTFVQRGTVMGVSGEVEWTVDAVDVPHRVELSADGPGNTRLRVCFLLAPSVRGSQLTCVYEITGPRMIGLLVRAGKKEAERHTRASMARLDALAQVTPIGRRPGHAEPEEAAG